MSLLNGLENELRRKEKIISDLEINMQLLNETIIIKNKEISEISYNIQISSSEEIKQKES